MNSVMCMTHYGVLGVPFDATAEQVRSAYWAQIQFYHPNVFTGDASVAEAKAKQLNESYLVLSNPVLRAEYDKSLCSKPQDTEQLEYREVIYSSVPTAKSAKSTFHIINRIFSICLLASVIVAVFIFASRRWSLKQPEETTLSESAQNEAADAPGDAGSDKADTKQKPSKHVPINGGPIPTEFNWMHEDLQANIVIHAPTSEHVFVKLKRATTGVTMYQFFVRAGETADVDIPVATYNVCFAFGKEWYGIDNLFGEETTCSVDKGIRFTRTSGYEYTLYPVADGNLHLEPLSMEEMLKG